MTIKKKFSNYYPWNCLDSVDSNHDLGEDNFRIKLDVIIYVIYKIAIIKYS